MNASDLLKTVKAGTRVTILVPNGKRIVRDPKTGTARIETEWKESSGRAVMRGPAGWVLNMGGQYGTPGIASEDNLVAVGKKRVG